jgi:DNA-binding transcriptional LysR family regulator
MDLATVDLNLLVVFEAMMQERNVSRAAKRVGLAQPSLSNAVGRLRELFNDELFVRTPREMRPTAKAFELARPINDALNHIRTAFHASAETFDPAQSARSFWLAGVDFADAAILPDAVAMICREAPNIMITIRALAAREAIACLDDGTIDIAVGSFIDPPKRMGILAIRQENLVCVMRKGHPALSEEWTAHRFASLPHLTARFGSEMIDPIDAALEEHGLKRSIMLCVPSHMIVPFIVRSSDLVACASEGIARLYADVAGLEFRAPPIRLPARQISMLWSRRTENAFGLQWLRERVVAVTRQHKKFLRTASAS